MQVMYINDLSYLEDISDLNPISGGVLVGVDANALALGDSTFTLTNTDANVKQLGNGGFMGKGSGIAVASGDVTYASVSLYGDGDKVKTKVKEHYFSNQNLLVVRGSVMVKDKP